MSHVVDLKSRNPLLGTWKTCDGFSDMHFTVSAENGKLLVTGVDIEDGEKPDIRDVVWTEEKRTLEFSSYWASTGRLVKYRLRPAIAPGRAEVTYTYTAQETWERV
jgi:hypothetical protein